MRDRKASPGRSFLRALQSAFRSLNTPRSLGLHLLIEYREWDQLSAIDTDPREYLDTVSGIHRYFKDAQAASLVRKVPWPTSFSRKKRAEETFAACEAKCAETNHFIDWLESGILSDDEYLVACRRILSRAKRLASSILGPLPASLQGRFGPGTVFELKGSPLATAADKVSITPHVTEACASTFRWMYDATLWERSRTREGLPFMSLAPGNRFTTVPKDGKTDRGICIEPGGNVWVQLAIGDFMKDRLKRVGINVARDGRPLDPIQLLRWTPSLTGQQTHRRLAEEASAAGSWATIDLSNASDTVSRALVRAILPEAWYTLLDTSRSPKTHFKGRWVRLEKFSSMGNGFTFELETLLFLCLAHGVDPSLFPGENLFVYGDDIIVPAAPAKNVVACLQAFGFVPNPRKTFTTGLFRESCGGDYYSGFNVRPYFQKTVPETPDDWMQFYNGLSQFIRVPIQSFVSEVPKRFCLFGPPGTPGVFWTTDSSRWRVTTRSSITWIRRLVPTPRRLSLERWADWISLPLALLGVSSSGVTPVGKPIGFRIKNYSIS